MAVKTFVFRGDNRVLEMGGDCVGCHHPAKLFAAPGKHLPLSVEHCDRAPRAAIQEIADIG